MENQLSDRLGFKTSESHLLGFSDKLIHHPKKHMTNILGVSNLAGDALFITGTAIHSATTLADPFFLGGAIINGIARLPLLMDDHTKPARQKFESSTSLYSCQDETLYQHIEHKTRNALDPKDHPVEASAFLAMIAGSFFLMSGLGTLYGAESDGATSLGVMQLVLGVLSIGARILEVFTDPSKHTETNDEKSNQSILSNMYSWMQDNPEIVSGIIGVATSLLTLGIGMQMAVMAGGIDLASGLTMAAGVTWVASASLYAAFVRRNDEQNVAKDEPQEKPVIGKFTAKLKEEKDAIIDRTKHVPSLA